MKRLIQLEMLKLVPNRTFRIFTILYFAIVLGLTLLSYINIELGPFKFNFGNEGAFNFPLTWQFNTYVASYLKLFLAIILVTNIVNEFDFRTIKQNLIDGLSKKEFMYSKILSMVLLSLISTVLVFIIALLLGFKYAENQSLNLILSELYYIPVYFLSLVSFFSLMMFIAVVIRKSAFAFGILFIWATVESIIRGIWKTKMGSNHFNPGDYFPLQTICNLIHEPFTKLKSFKVITNMATQGQAKIDYGVHWSFVIMSIIYSVAFLYLTYWLIKKRDL
jgi:ABC-2 type transport system permease protein